MARSLQIILATLLLLISSEIVEARAFRTQTYQELFNNSDLVVIASPVATTDTKEHMILAGEDDIGVETMFMVSVVLKGNAALKDFILHHYRAGSLQVPNGPSLISFDSIDKQYLLFLTRESDGRYSPTFGQTDPGLCGIELLGKHQMKISNQAQRTPYGRR
jgi:hypothetical protein